MAPVSDQPRDERGDGYHRPAGQATAAGAQPDQPRSVVEALVAALNAHNGKASRALFSADAVVVSAGGRQTDLAGMDRMHASTLDAFPDLRLRVTRWVVDGDTVVTEEIMEGTHLGVLGGFAPTGRRVALRMVHVTRVVDGQIVERVSYHDTASLLAQLGDAPEPRADA